MRLLGIDHGVKRIGIALGDTEENIVTDFCVLEEKAEAKNIEKICEIGKEEHIEKIIIGLPLSLAGRETAQTKEVIRFAQRLQKRMIAPVEFFDERLSTAMFKHMRKKELLGKSKDALSAAVILQGYMESRR